jgi:hypothetical protein
MHKVDHDPAYVHGAHYEKRDISLPIIIRWVIYLFIFCAIGALAAWITYVIFLPKGRDPRALAPLTAEQQRPPAPVLQAYPKVEMREFRVKENETLISYGWVKKETGEVHIPIEEAIKLTAERGLPVGQPPVSKTDKEMRPGNRQNGATNPVEIAPSANPTGTNPPPDATRTDSSAH